MYAVGLIISFKIALLISLFLVLSGLRAEAEYFRKLGVSDSKIKRFYRENLVSSSVTVAQVTLVVGFVFSFISLTTIWTIS
jgi:hypothetical protein